jgi:VanZ family protein
VAPLARYLLAAYALILVYGSLYPLSGWRVPGPDSFAFLRAPLPQFITSFDIAVNAAAYLPFGALLASVLPRTFPAAGAIALATIAGAALAFTLEWLQTYIPTRVPSNVDLGLNVVGALLGAVAAVALRRRGASTFAQLRTDWFRGGNRVDFGLMILGLWLLTQLNPETLLFGNGDLRDLFAAVPHQLVPPAMFVRIEALISAANLIAVALFAGALVMPPRPAWVVVTLFVLVALAVRTVAYGVLFTPSSMLGWMTPGALLGLGVGALAAVAGGRLPRGVRMAIAGVLLMVATVTVNFAPGNPYLANSLAVWRQGHFLNFNGLTAFVSAAWPFVALAYLLFASTRGEARG